MTETVQNLSGHMEDGVFTFKVRVYYEDTDFSGIVYHASYLRFIERARSEYLRYLDITHSALENDPNGPYAMVVRHMDINFLDSARIDDILVVRTTPVKLGGASMVLSQDVYIAGKGARPILSARVKIAFVHLERGPTRLPEELKEKMQINTAVKIK